MPKLIVTVGGLSLLVASKREKKAQIALINPDVKQMLPSDRRFAADHRPLVIVRKENIKQRDGHNFEFSLDQSVRAAFLDNATSLEPFVGWSAQGGVVTFRDLALKDESTGGAGQSASSLDFDLTPVEPNEQGCNDTGSWNSLNWIASSTQLSKSLRLAPEWTESPHVGARVVLNTGRLSAAPPVVTNAGLLKVDLGTGVKPRVFTDAFRYEVDLEAPAVIIDAPPRRWRLQLKAQGNEPIRMWILSLDDELASEHGVMDHFVLYSLLPWRFRRPRVAGACQGGGDTEGGCINMSHFNELGDE
jgi:hypothetical protein